MDSHGVGCGGNLRGTDAQPPITISTHHTFLFFYTYFTTRGVLEKAQIIFYPFLTL
jgi:hypothetical protein